jgi:hypothetical protein
MLRLVLGNFCSINALDFVVFKVLSAHCALWILNQPIFNATLVIQMAAVQLNQLVLNFMFLELSLL